MHEILFILYKMGVQEIGTTRLGSSLNIKLHVHISFFSHFFIITIIVVPGLNNFINSFISSPLLPLPSLAAEILGTRLLEAVAQTSVSEVIWSSHMESFPF